ncbi:hypothetical protein PINS_up006898 [Pythium insidiosum]|nr:hypothetical protein PINS_up006898 [Pythium insidiosum]
MKPHPKFLLAVLPFFFSEGEAVDGGGRQYSDDISWNQVAYVQTPQYFEDTPQAHDYGRSLWSQEHHFLRCRAVRS